MIEILTTYISIYTFITFIIISHYIVSHIYYYFVNIIFNDINLFDMINKILLLNLLTNAVNLFLIGTF